MTAYLVALALAALVSGLYLERSAGPDGWLTHAAGVGLQTLAVVLFIITAIIQ